MTARILCAICVAAIALSGMAQSDAFALQQQPQGFATFQEVLAARGVDASQLAHMFDDRPFSTDEQETLERTLAALVNLPQEIVDRYAKPAEQLLACMADPDEHRGDVIQLAGTVTACRAIAVAPELIERLGYSVTFRSTVEVPLPDGGRFTCDVFSPIAPLEWLTRANQEDDAARPPVMNEPVTLQAVFLKRASIAGEDHSPARPVLATRRLSWYPDNLLGQARFDVASLEEVVPDSKLTAADAPAFHGLLSTLRGVKRQELETAAQQTLVDRRVAGATVKETSRQLMVGFMAEPTAWRGAIVTLQGIARRALKVHVDDPQLIAEYGTREYYEVEVFIEGPFRLPGFDDVVARYPVTFCTSSLPAGLEQGERLSVPVRLTGMYLKNWRYRSAMFTEKDAGLQRAPLIIGGPLQQITETGQLAAPWGQRELTLAIGVFVLILAAAFVCWRWGRRDHVASRRRAQVLNRDRADEA